jgi:hypothetical protein
VSIIGHYIAGQIGNQMGQTVSDGIIKSLDANSQNSEEEAKEIYQAMKAESEDIFANWQVPILLISLPTKSLMNPFVVKARKAQFNRLISKEISKEQLLTQGRITDSVANFVNSLCFGLLAYLVLSLFKKYKRET